MLVLISFSFPVGIKHVSNDDTMHTTSKGVPGVISPHIGDHRKLRCQPHAQLAGHKDSRFDISSGHRSRAHDRPAAADSTPAANLQSFVPHDGESAAARRRS